VKDDVAKGREFGLGMIVNDVYWGPRRPAATCFAHTERDVDHILSVAEKVLKEMEQ
jgi:glutamate-1-semialdehyde aminotransferase